MRSATVNGAAIRAAREERSLTLAELATLTGAHEGSLSHIETGNRQPSAKLFAAICTALGAERAAFLVRESDEAA